MLLSLARYSTQIIALAGIVSCGGGGGGSSGTTETGSFIDSFVEGLNYSTPTQTGITDSFGQFEYKPGEHVSFSIGGIYLGSAIADTYLTPMNLIPGTTNPSNSNVLNLVRFLISLDDDANPENGILISSAYRLAAELLNVDFQTLSTDVDIQNLLDNVTGSTVTLISARAAEIHYLTSLYYESLYYTKVYTDPATGLMWKRETEFDKANWYQANGVFDPISNPMSVDVCGSLSQDGFNDWRLPTRKELLSIMDYSKRNTAVISVIYLLNRNGFYWTSTSYAGDLSRAWTVLIYDGSLHGLPGVKSVDADLLCVRGAQLPAHVFVDNLNGTVSDASSELMWQQADDDTARSWDDANAYCAALSLAGNNDWRLPELPELISIVDEGAISPSIKAEFTGTKSGRYWSATHRAGVPTDAWPVNFFDGGTPNGLNPRTDLHFVRCVRDI